MKTLTLAAAILGMSTLTAAADPASGTWKTQPGDTGGYAHVSIAPCGANVCGVLRKAFQANGQPVANYEHTNRQMIWDMKPNGDGTYANGKIWAPDRDKTYKSKMRLSGNTLVVEGCVLGICRAQNWTRVK